MGRRGAARSQDDLLERLKAKCGFETEAKYLHALHHRPLQPAQDTSRLHRGTFADWRRKVTRKYRRPID